MKRYIRAKIDLDKLDAYGRQARDSHLRKLMDDDENRSDMSFRNHMSNYSRRLVREETINRVYDEFNEINQDLVAIAKKYNWSLDHLMRYLIKSWGSVYADCNPNTDKTHTNSCGFVIKSDSDKTTLYIDYQDKYEGTFNVAYIIIRIDKGENPEFSLSLYRTTFIDCIITLLKNAYNFDRYSIIDNTDKVKSELHYILDELFSAIESRMQDLVREYIEDNPPSLQDV